MNTKMKVVDVPNDKSELDKKTQASSSLTMGFAAFNQTNLASEIVSKLKSEQIPDFLLHVEKRDEIKLKELKEKNKTERFFVIGVFVIIALILIGVFITLFVMRDSELTKILLTAVITAIISGLGGYGFGKSGRKD